MLRQAARSKPHPAGVEYMIAFNYTNTVTTNVTFKWQSNLTASVEVFQRGPHAHAVAGYVHGQLRALRSARVRRPVKRRLGKAGR